MPEAVACKASKVGRPYGQKKDPVQWFYFIYLFFVPVLLLPVGGKEEWSQTLFL